MNTQRFKHRWTLAGVVALFLAMGAWWLTRAEHDQRASEHSQRASESSDYAASGSDGADIGFASSAAVMARNSVPSIPASADLSQLSVIKLLDLLGDRARAGDPVAACELATALQTCRFELRTRYLIQPSPPPNASEAELEAFVSFHAGFQEQRARDAQRCAGVGAAERSEMVYFVAHAALAGHVDSLTRFMLAPERHAADFMRDPRLSDLYRTRLWPVLQRAFATGNPELAQTVLTLLSDPFQPALSVIVPEAYRDQEIATALLSLSIDEPASPRSLASNRPPPTPAAIQAARQWVDELFDGQMPDLSEAHLSRRREALSRSGTACDSTSAWLPR